MSEHRVNQFTVIKDFKRLPEFETHLKHGNPSTYQKFTGTLEGKEVKGLINVDDKNIYGLKEIK